MKNKFNTNNNFSKNRGFTLGLALIVVAATLLISLSISSILIRDLKNSASNERSSMAYNLAESALECIVSYDNNIRYFDVASNNITGLFPTSTAYSILAQGSELIPADSILGVAQGGYAYKNYIAGDPNNKFFIKRDIRCFGNEILSNINLSIAPLDNEVVTTLKVADPSAPAGYYNSNPALNGVVTNIKIKKDINTEVGKSFFQEYLQKACIDINIYTVFDGEIYKKIISAEASVPCTGKNASKRVLVRYIQ